VPNLTCNFFTRPPPLLSLYFIYTHHRVGQEKRPGEPALPLLSWSTFALKGKTVGILAFVGINADHINLFGLTVVSLRPVSTGIDDTGNRGIKFSPGQEGIAQEATPVEIIQGAQQVGQPPAGVKGLALGLFGILGHLTLFFMHNIYISRRT
jgi:hypothetical protein